MGLDKTCRNRGSFCPEVRGRFMAYLNRTIGISYLVDPVTLSTLSLFLYLNRGVSWPS